MDLLALRYERSGLAERTRSLAGAAACPLSDFARDAALRSLAARAEGVTRAAYDAAIEAGELVVAHSLRCAIHVHAPGDEAVFGWPLIGSDEPGLDEVSAAIREALAAGPLDKDALHEAMRMRVRGELLPWCPVCKSHHVDPNLWRRAAVKVGTRLDAQRRLHLHEADPVPPVEAVRRFQRFYPGASPADFGAWAGIATTAAKRIWTDEPAPAPAPEPRGVRLLPPGDPFLQKPNRELLVPDPELRKRLFRPAGSPGVVLQDGRVGGTWRLRKGRVEVESLVRLRQGELDGEVERALSALA